MRVQVSLSVRKGKEMKDVKQVIVIRKDLKMRRGKEIAQGAHASIAFLTNRLILTDTQNTGIAMGYFSDAERRWVREGFRKICCVVNSESELLDLVEQAKLSGVTCELIRDSGLTEFGGAATYTAAAFGPDYEDKIDLITGELVLY